MKNDKIKITQLWNYPNFKDNLFNIVYKYWDDNSEYHYNIDKFKDYFYYPINDIEDLTNFVNNGYISIEYIDEKMNFKKTLFNNTVIKVFIEKLSFRYKLLNDNKKRTELETKIKHNSFMLDVLPELKHFNESKKFQWSQDRHILYFDIETWYDPKIPDANKPQIAMKPITSIQLYSTLSNEYFILIWHPSFKHNKKDVLNEIIKIEGIELNVIKCKTELLMYQSFINLFRMLNPDIISGWYSNGYDVPYLINRASVLGIANEFKRISPGKWTSSKYNSIKRVFYNTIKGVDHIDMMDAVQSLNIKLPNNKLNTAAEIILGSDMTKIKTSSWKDWDIDLDGFIKYGFRDVQILKEIDQKLDIFNFFYNIQDITNITQLKQKFTQTVLIDNFLTSRYFDKNKIFPTNIRAEKVEFMGAFVKQPVAVGAIRNVSIFDYASLYPTTEMAMNLSPETFIISHKIAVDNGLDIDEHVIPELIKNGVDFIDTGYSDELVEGRYLFMSHKTKIGVYPESLHSLYINRLKLKSEMKKYVKNSSEYNILDKKQYVMKIILNSMYGAMASEYFRLNNFRVADATTFFGRKLIKIAEKYFQAGYKYTKMSKYLRGKYGKI